MIKNRFILCTIVLAYSLSIGAMQYRDFSVINKNTMQPLGILYNGQRLNFKTRLTQLKQDPDQDSSIHEAEIIVLTHENPQQNQPAKNVPAVHYYLVPHGEAISPIEIDEAFIDSIMTTIRQSPSKNGLLFQASNSNNPSQPRGILRITKKSCETALATQPQIFIPIQQREQKQAKKPKNVCTPQQELENSIKAADLPKDFKLPFRQASENEKKYSDKTPEKRQRRYFEEAGNNQFKHQNELAALYSKMQKENSDAIKNHFSQTAQSFAYRISEINKLNDQKPNATELSEKEKAIKLLAHDMAHHYLSAIVNNKDLNVPSFADYTELINSDMRKLEHKLFQHQEARDLSTTFREASNQSNLIVTEQQDHDAPFIKAIEKLEKQDNYRFPKAVLKNGLSVGAEVAISIAMSTAGEFAAAGILSLVDNPEQTKYESDLKKGIKEGEEYLEENSTKNIRQKHIKERLEETQKNRQQFDIHNVEALDRKELAQKIKDLYEQQN